jgi:hypothetical protein
MSVNNLKATIYSIISPIITIYDNDIAPNNSVFPYSTYELKNIDADNEYDGSSIILEFNVWDNKADTTTLDSVCDMIKAALKNKIVNLSSVKAKIYFVNRQALNDEDINLRRRVIQFELKAYI